MQQQKNGRKVHAGGDTFIFMTASYLFLLNADRSRYGIFLSHHQLWRQSLLFTIDIGV